MPTYKKVHYKQVNLTSGKGYEVKVYLSGDKYWYLNGKSHRVNGPAIVYHAASAVIRKHEKEYFLYGKEVSPESFNKVQNCPLEELPLYINSDLAPIALERLNVQIQTR